MATKVVTHRSCENCGERADHKETCQYGGEHYYCSKTECVANAKLS